MKNRPHHRPAMSVEVEMIQRKPMCSWGFKPMAGMLTVLSVLIGILVLTLVVPHSQTHRHLSDNATLLLHVFGVALLAWPISIVIALTVHRVYVVWKRRRHPKLQTTQMSSNGKHCLTQISSAFQMIPMSSELLNCCIESFHFVIDSNCAIQVWSYFVANQCYYVQFE